MFYSVIQKRNFEFLKKNKQLDKKLDNIFGNKHVRASNNF